MIDLSLKEDQEMLLRTIEDFAKKEIKERIREIERDGADDIRKKIFELGIGGVEFPEKIGGAGMGMLERALILKTMAENGDGGATYSAFSFLPAAYVLYDIAEDEKLAGEIISGKKKVALAKAGFYPDSVSTKAEAKEGAKVIVEEKEPEIIVFFAKDGNGFSLCISDNFQKERELFRSGVLSSPASEYVVLRFEKLREGVERSQNWGRFLARLKLFSSSICIGICKVASDYALQYALDRITFGRPIAYHQAISFMLADLDTFSSALELMLSKAGWEFDSGKETYEDMTTELLLETLELGKKITSDALQILGGHGYIQDHPVEKWMRDFEDIINAFGSPARYEGTIKNLETGI